ncbi:hypothetical protein [Aeromonas veronii]|uniref:hypothetical protein n=1 Tax=Aeromonas veronii TaxID=654 RepID=UPI003DA3DB7E
MAGLWYRVGTVSVTNGSNKVTGFGTKWKTSVSKPDKGHTVWAPDGKAYELDYVESDTVLYLVTAYIGVTASGMAYSIDISRSGSNSAFSRDLSAFVAYHQLQMDGWQQLLTGTGDVTLTAPDGTKLTVPSWEKIMNAGTGVVAQAKAEADRAKAAADSINPEAGAGKLMRVGGPAILDSERYSLERATGGSQTIIRDSAGNANAMFVLPRFSYADLGMTADMGTGDATAFDFGSGSIKSEIFIGAYLASGAGAVSAPRQDPRASLDHTAARAACSAKGAGWHLMTAHEWAAIALWCMANGYEPIGNTNWGRNHAKTWLIGDRADGLAPGDASGTGRTQTGSLGPAATHNNAVSGIADLVGNVWEWQDGFLLMDGRFKLSSFNTQAEDNWAFVDAYLDASSPTGGSPILSNAITNRLGAIGDNANAGNYANSDWRIMAKAGGYVSNQALRRLLIEPATILPQGHIYMRNFGERLPGRGGGWYGGASAGLAALDLGTSRAGTHAAIGCRPAFA